jgi:uncharacterized membrane protein
MKSKRYDINNTLLFTQEGGKMKLINKFLKKHRKKIIYSIIALFLILCVIFISRKFIVAILGLLGITGLYEIEKNNYRAIDEIKQKRQENERVKNEKSKDITNTSYDDVDLSTNESVKYIKKRIRDRKDSS